jgi:hypothetical protein
VEAERGWREDSASKENEHEEEADVDPEAQTRFGDQGPCRISIQPKKEHRCVWQASEGELEGESCRDSREAARDG